MVPIPFAPPIKVKYQILPGYPKTLWPIIDLKLSYKEQQFPYRILALVDSGASNSIIRPEIAQFLGFDLSGGMGLRGQGVSGIYESIALPEPINVEIWGHKFSFKFQVIKEMIWPCILGEDSIFEVARLDFQKFKGFFELRFRQDIN